MQTIHAFEDKFVSKIDTFTVGMLIEIKPPCEIRRGIIMLGNQNIDVIWSPKLIAALKEV